MADDSTVKIETTEEESTTITTKVPTPEKTPKQSRLTGQGLLDFLNRLTPDELRKEVEIRNDQQSKGHVILVGMGGANTHKEADFDPPDERDRHPRQIAEAATDKTRPLTKRSNRKPEVDVLEYASRQEEIRHRRSIRSKLYKIMKIETGLGFEKALRKAEKGTPLPIHFDIRVAQEGITVLKRFSLISVKLSTMIFEEDGLDATEWNIVPRPKELPPHFVHEEEIVPIHIQQSA